MEMLHGSDVDDSIILFLKEMLLKKKSEQLDLLLVSIWREVKMKIENCDVIYWRSAKKDKGEEGNYLGGSFSMDI